MSIVGIGLDPVIIGRPISNSKLVGTEDWWFACEDPIHLLRMQPPSMMTGTWIRPAFLKNLSNRKLRLLACGISREAITHERMFPEGVQPKFVEAIVEAEYLAEFGNMPPAAYERGRRKLGNWAVLASYAPQAVAACCEFARQERWAVDVIRDIVGNPFSFTICNDEYLQLLLLPEVVGLTREVYEDKNLHLVSILADMLEDKGANPAGSMLLHLRNGKPHYLGCWVIDYFRDIQAGKADEWATIAADESGEEQHELD